MKSQVIELIPGANHIVVPEGKDPGPPEGFVDNTVYRYRIINGEKVLVGTMDGFPDGWDNTNPIKQQNKWPKPFEAGPDERRYSGPEDKKGEDNMILRKDKTEIVAKAKELMKSTDKPVAQIARELGVPESTLHTWLQRDKQQTPKPVPVRAAKPTPEQSPEEPAATSVNPSQVAVKEQKYGDVGDMPAGYALEPKLNQEDQTEQVTQYISEDNDWQPEDDEPLPYIIETVNTDVDAVEAWEQLKISWLKDICHHGLIKPGIKLRFAKSVIDMQLSEVG